MIQYLWSDPAAAAQTVKDDFFQDAQACIRLADDVCRNRFTFRGHWEMERTHTPVDFPGEIVWDDSPNGDPEWVFAFNRNSFLVTLGQAWQLTGLHKYPEAASRLWADWIDRVPLTESSAATTWRPIEAGLRCENWLRALGLFYDTLAPDLLQQIVDCLRCHAQWLLTSHTPFQKLSNWGVLQDHGLLLLGLALGESAWCDTAAARLSEQLGHQVLADGTHWEQSPLYHCEVLHCCLDSIQASKRMGYSLPPAFVERTHAMAVALGKMLRPDGKLFCQSDSDEVDARDLLALAALLFESPVLKGWAAEKVYAENCWDFSDQFMLYSKIDGVAVKGSTALPDSGNYMLRDGPGPDAGMLHFHCGTLGSGHGHADLLHVDLVHNGESILMDSGRYTYVDGDIRQALKRPAGHNTIVVDESDFTVYRSSWSYAPIAEPIKGTHRFTPQADYVSGAHLGYLGLGVFIRRRVLRLGQGLWLIWDDFAVADSAVPHTYDRYFHFSPEGSAVLDDNAVAYTGGKSAARALFLGDDLEYRLQREPVSREYNLLEQSDCLRVRAQRKGPGGLATVVATGKAGADIALTATLGPISLSATGKTLSPAQGQAVHICLGGEKWTVLLLNTEVISEVSLLEAGGCQGYGKTIVSGPSCPNGVSLAW